MKKLLTILIFILSLSFSFAQSQMTFVGLELRTGMRDKLTDEFKWDDWEEIDETDIILEKDKITMNSNIPQNYIVTKKEWFDDVEGFYWTSYNDKGKPCRIYFLFEEYTTVGVEFDDYGWEYKVRRKK